MDEYNIEGHYTARKIDSEHKDLIHDVSFDFFGKRMATCSSDQSVKVWDLNENDDWICTASWKTHHASVWKVTWAHPEFGQILATCSFDRTAAVWAETVVGDGDAQLNHNWIHKVNLVDSRTSVKDVKFAPKHLGLQLATCSANGVVRIYEAPDVMNLTQWTMQYQLHCKISCSCIAWNPSTYRYHAPMLAVGSDDSNTSAGGKVFIFEYNDANREWVKISTIMKITEPVNDLAFAPNMGRTYHILAIASQDLHIFNLKTFSGGENQPTSEPTELNFQPVAQFPDHNSKVTRLAWNDLGTVLLSTGDDGRVLLWMANYVGIWKRVGSLKNSIANPAEIINRYQSLPSSEQAGIQNKTGSSSSSSFRVNFRRFIPNRDPPSPRSVDPRFAGAYY